MDQKIRIAVSGAGGGVGQSIIKSLQNTDYEVVALDGEVLGTGLYAAKKSYVIPYANSPDYLGRVFEICQLEGCKLFFPGLDAELPVLAEAVEHFTNVGTRVIVSSPEVIALSDDKMLTATTLGGYGISVPDTVDMSTVHNTDPPLSYPFILKIKIGGARSQGIHLIKTAMEWQRLTAQGVDLSGFVAQQYIEGDEYTCGSINLDNKCQGVIVMRRILRDGDTYKCFSVKNQVIEEQVHKVMNAIKPFGACNVQLRLKDNVPYVFEINARCSGTTGARTLCGFNEPRMIADFLCHGVQPEFTITEQTILRYWNELVVDNDMIAELRQNGLLNNEAPPRL